MTWQEFENLLYQWGVSTEVRDAYARLLQRDDEFCQISDCHYNPLMAAASMNHVEIAKKLMGIYDPLWKGQLFWSAIFYAVNNGHVETTMLLLPVSDRFARDSAGNRFMDVAVLRKELKMFSCIEDFYTKPLRDVLVKSLPSTGFRL